jgi:hypothetical protein
MAANSHLPAERATVSVHVPMRFRRRGGRKLIASPADSPSRPRPAERTDHGLTILLARAHRWRALLEAGVFGTISEIAAAEGINDSYASRVLRLTLLAPDIVEAILNDLPMDPEIRMLRPFPLEWANQRRLLS